MPVEPFLNVHTRGLDAREGDLLLARGTRLGAPELAVLASAGLPRADVRIEPRILIATTGDELVAPDQPIAAWQVRRSNSHALRGALEPARPSCASPKTTCRMTTPCSPSDSRRTSPRTT